MRIYFKPTCYILMLLAMILFSLFIWPTQFRYEKIDHTNSQTGKIERILIRINRITGTPYRLDYKDGWKEIIEQPVQISKTTFDPDKFIKENFPPPMPEPKLPTHEEALVIQQEYLKNAWRRVEKLSPGSFEIMKKDIIFSYWLKQGWDSQTGIRLYILLDKSFSRGDIGTIVGIFDAYKDAKKNGYVKTDYVGSVAIVKNEIPPWKIENISEPIDISDFDIDAFLAPPIQEKKKGAKEKSSSSDENLKNLKL